MVIFTNGCFDCLHAGHIQFLLYCRGLAQGDPLYVGIDSDKKIAREKGAHRPYFNEKERRLLLMRLSANGQNDLGKLNPLVIDWVDVFNSDQELHFLIKKIDPDYIVKGNDWRGKKIVGQDIAPVIYAPAFHKNYCSTSEIEKRILNGNARREKETTTKHEDADRYGAQSQSNWRLINWRRDR